MIKIEFTEEEIKALKRATVFFKNVDEAYRFDEMPLVNVQTDELHILFKENNDSLKNKLKSTENNFVELSDGEIAYINCGLDIMMLIALRIVYSKRHIDKDVGSCNENIKVYNDIKNKIIVAKM